MDDYPEDDFFDDVPPAPQKQKKNTARRVVSVLLGVILCAVGFLAGWFGNYYSLDKEVRTFLWAKGVADRHYYRDIDEDALYESLYDLLDLDPFSMLYTPDGYDSYVAQGAGQNTGIGLSFVEETLPAGVLPRIFLVVGNSPAEAAGLEKGMYLLGFGKTKEEAAQPRTGGTQPFLDFFAENGEAPFFVRCGFSADGSDAALYSLTRKRYQASFCYYRDSESSFRFRYADSSQSSAEAFSETGEPMTVLPADTAYLRLDEFSGNAAEEFLFCLLKFHERGRTNLILDLRSNGGGYLDILTEIAAHLVKDAEGNSPVIARAYFKNGAVEEYPAIGNDYSAYFREDARVLVLADENTASASECLIGALVDYGTVPYRDIFLRENEQGIAKSYGKGIMQHTYVALSGAAMKLTVAEIKWPNGKSIHGVGVVPADGATPVPAPLLCGAEDPMLLSAIAALNA